MQPDAPLTARGFAQARALASQLAPRTPDLIVSSPFLRARQTVEPLAQTLATPIEIEPRLAERTLAAEPPQEFRSAVRHSLEDLDQRLPGGETSREAQRRGRQAIEAILQRGHRLPVVATHGQILTLILNSIDPAFGFAGWESLSNPDVYLVEADGPRWSFRRVSDGAGNANALRDEQYGDSRNLSARMALHARFATNRHGWFRWVFDRLPPLQVANMLEIGCGAGWLWRENRSRVLPGWNIHLSDFSPGMLAETRQSLADVNAHFVVADALSLPFVRIRFHTVIANHMLYHVPDRQRALRGVARLLTPDGCLVAATVGKRHLAELDALLSEVGVDQAELGNSMVTSFTLENGALQIAAAFDRVMLERYSNALRVTEVDPVIAYLQSMPVGRALTPDMIARIRGTVARAIEQHGAFEVATDTGVFIASNSPRGGS